MPIQPSDYLHAERVISGNIFPGKVSAQEVASLARPIIAAASVPPQDVNDNDLITLDEVRAETGWELAASAFSFSGSPDRVRISAQIAQLIPVGNFQRPAPALLLQKLISGEWETIAKSATGYIRDASGHEESSNTITWCDFSPGGDPSYRLMSEQESNNGAVTTSTFGQFSLEAFLL